MAKPLVTIRCRMCGKWVLKVTVEDGPAKYRVAGQSPGATLTADLDGYITSAKTSCGFAPTSAVTRRPKLPRMKQAT